MKVDGLKSERPYSFFERLSETRLFIKYIEYKIALTLVFNLIKGRMWFQLDVGEIPNANCLGVIQPTLFTRIEDSEDLPR